VAVDVDAIGATVRICRSRAVRAPAGLESGQLRRRESTAQEAVDPVPIDRRAVEQQEPAVDAERRVLAGAKVQIAGATPAREPHEVVDAHRG